MATDRDYELIRLRAELEEALRERDRWRAEVLELRARVREPEGGD